MFCIYSIFSLFVIFLTTFSGCQNLVASVYKFLSKLFCDFRVSGAITMFVKQLSGGYFKYDQTNIQIGAN